jgi:hypothetical protein
MKTLSSSQIVSLNDLSSSDVENAVWDASLSSHNTGGTTGKSLKQIKEGTITIESSINDTAATTTSFVTSLTETTTSYYSNKIMVFIDGNLSGQARIITNYNGTTKTITLEEPLTSAPADGDQFLILATHENSIEEIADGVWNELGSGHTTAGTFGYYLDASISGIAVSGGDASSANQTTIIGHLTDIKGGTFSGSTDSLEAIRDRGDAAWTTSGAGIYTLTCTVKDASDNLISGARVNLDGTTSTATSNSQGIAVFNVDAGSYTLVTSPPSGYQTPANVSVTISADSTATIVLTQASDAGNAGWLG